jgi:hypothetical protein
VQARGGEGGGAAAAAAAAAAEKLFKLKKLGNDPWIITKL